MKKIVTLAAVAAGLSASPALAQSASPGGFYIGALGGYEGIDVESADGSVSADADSAVYGVNVGYDLSLGSAFVGIEGELSTSSGDTEFPDSFTGAREGLEANGQYYIGARAGVALTPGIAAYGKVGYTSLDTKAFTSSGSLDELEDNAGGLRFGGGVQVQLPGPLEARVEYRRSKYKDLIDGTFGDATTDQVVEALRGRGRGCQVLTRERPGDKARRAGIPRRVLVDAMIHGPGRRARSASGIVEVSSSRMYSRAISQSRRSVREAVAVRRRMATAALSLKSVKCDPFPIGPLPTRF